MEQVEHMHDRYVSGDAREKKPPPRPLKLDKQSRGRTQGHVEDELQRHQKHNRCGRNWCVLGGRGIMIRAVTLHNIDEQGNATPDLHERVAQLGLRQIDILCCQGVWRTMDDSEDETRIMAKSLHMNYSFFAANHAWKRKTQRKMNWVRGLAILTGTGIWPLNSGSFQGGVDESDGSKGIVQFALVRKNGSLILVLNLQLAESRQLQLLQLKALFSHPMLKKQYGAVVLCGDRRTILSAQELQAITKRSHYTSHSPPPIASSPGDGLLWILVAGKQPVAFVTIHNQQLSSSLEFDIDRIAQDKNYRPYSWPLSFEEQWSGYKTNAKPSLPESIIRTTVSVHPCKTPAVTDSGKF
jgi:hypothetical protein